MHTKFLVWNLKGLNHLEYTTVNGYPCGLFYAIVSILAHVVSKVIRLVTDEFETILKVLDFVPNEVIFRHFPEGLRKTMGNLSEDMRFSGQDSNRETSELKSRALPLRQTFCLPSRRWKDNIRMNINLLAPEFYI